MKTEKGLKRSHAAGLAVAIVGAGTCRIGKAILVSDPSLDPGVCVVDMPDKKRGKRKARHRNTNRWSQ